MSEEGQSSIELEQARKALLWLSFECSNGGNPKECQLYSIRSLGLEARREWVLALPEEEVLRRFAEHRACECRRSRESRLDQPAKVESQ